MFYNLKSGFVVYFWFFQSAFIVWGFTGGPMAVLVAYNLLFIYWVFQVCDFASSTTFSCCTIFLIPFLCHLASHKVTPANTFINLTCSLYTSLSCQQKYFVRSKSCLQPPMYVFDIHFNIIFLTNL